MTWNVEGHEPLDMEEAVPQLGYLAYDMTLSRRQTLSTVDIRQQLLEARDELPEILSYARASPAAFVERVESTAVF